MTRGEKILRLAQLKNLEEQQQVTFLDQVTGIVSISVSCMNII